MLEKEELGVIHHGVDHPTAHDRNGQSNRKHFWNKTKRLLVNGSRRLKYTDDHAHQQTNQHQHGQVLYRHTADKHHQHTGGEEQHRGGKIG